MTISGFGSASNQQMTLGGVHQVVIRPFTSLKLVCDRPCIRLKPAKAVDSDNSGQANDPSKIVLPPPPNLGTKKPRKSWNAVALAFLGDGVWEMYIRRKFFYPPTNMQQYYASVVGNVRAEKQEEAYKYLLASEFLTDEERSVLQWGLNATGTTPKRFSQVQLKKETYRAATAFECLVGYLYLENYDRLFTMFELLDNELVQAATKKRK